MHSENLTDQDRAVRLFHTRMPDAGGQPDARPRTPRDHPQFWSFSYRNDALDRSTTAAEAQFMTEGGYGSMLRKMQSADA